VWPGLLRSDDSPTAGFAIGWTETLGTYHKDAGSKNIQNHERVVVAGVVPLPNDCVDGESSSYVAAENEIRSRLQKLRDGSCFCCRCEDAQHDGRFQHQSHSCKVDSYCSGCVRKFCLDNIQVVALYLKHGSKTQNSSLPELPRIVDSNDDFPWWESDATQAPEERRDEGQLVFYDDIGRSKSFCLYRGLFFNDDHLIRLTHASLIISMVDAGVNDVDRKAAKEEEEDLRSSSCSQSSESAVFSVRTTAFRHRYLLRQLSRLSLVVRHSCLDLIVGNREHSNSLPIATLAPPRLWNGVTESQQRRGGRCEECHKCTGMFRSRYETVAADLDRADTTLRAKLDVLCGLTLGALLYLACFREGAAEHARVVVSAYFSETQRGITWLGRFPIGFKLNERLTERIGDALRLLLEINKTLFLLVLDWVFDCRLWSFYWVVILFASITVGASGEVAILVDAIHLFTFQLSLLSFCFRKVYRVQLYLLAALWRLLRGKKKNILRNRTDTMEYDSTQLLLGTILFTIATTLLSTVFVYHLFFAAACFAVEVCLLPLYVLHLLLLQLPAGRLMLRNRTSYFNDDIGLLVHKSANSSNNISFDVASLVASEKGYLWIAKDYLHPGFSAIACDLYHGFIGLITGSFKSFPPLLGDSFYSNGQTHCPR
jgi:N-acetylglucosaminyl transferase component (Gpi1)